MGKHTMIKYFKYKNKTHKISTSLIYTKFHKSIILKYLVN